MMFSGSGNAVASSFADALKRPDSIFPERYALSSRSIEKRASATPLSKSPAPFASSRAEDPRSSSSMWANMPSAGASAITVMSKRLEAVMTMRRSTRSPRPSIGRSLKAASSAPLDCCTKRALISEDDCGPATPSARTSSSRTRELRWKRQLPPPSEGSRASLWGRESMETLSISSSDMSTVRDRSEKGVHRSLRFVASAHTPPSFTT